MSTPIRVLIVEDSEDDTVLILRELRRGGYKPTYERVETDKAMKAALDNQTWDIIICDYNLPQFSMQAALEALQKWELDLPFILVSGTVGEETAVKAMKAGVHDYIMKDRLARLVPAIERELREAKKRREHKQAENAIRTLVKSIVGVTGQDFFDSIVSNMCEWLGSDYAFIGKINDMNTVTALSMQLDRKIINDYGYTIGDGPCENVIKDGYCVYTEGVCKLFPNNKVLSELKAEGYVGIPLRDKSSKPIGILWTVSRNKLNIPPRTAEVMDIIAAKADSEVERMRAEEQLRIYNEELEKLLEERTKRIHELERQRMENEKLAITGRMAARVAHEINNPLAGIQYSFLLIKDCVPEDHKHYGYVGMIEKEIKRIASIVKQMLDLNQPLNKRDQAFNINVTIRDVIAMLKGNCEKHGVEINYNTCNELLMVPMYEDSLRQVLFNIIQNAIEASPKGGEVKVTLKDGEEYLAIMVADNGSGISDELRSQIFEPFFTTKSEISTGGLGLGLSICKGILETMGGSLSFKSERNKGTTFAITIEMPIRVERKTEMVKP